jgi:hypothetical protein
MQKRENKIKLRRQYTRDYSFHSINYYGLSDNCLENLLSETLPVAAGALKFQRT